MPGQTYSRNFSLFTAYAESAAHQPLPALRRCNPFGPAQAYALDGRRLPPQALRTTAGIVLLADGAVARPWVAHLFGRR
jgi:hypothetical protein